MPKPPRKPAANPPADPPAASQPTNPPADPPAADLPDVPLPDRPPAHADHDGDDGDDEPPAAGMIRGVLENIASQIFNHTADMVQALFSLTNDQTALMLRKCAAERCDF